MLFSRRQGAYKEYMPLKIGFGRARLENGKIVLHDTVLELKKAAYNAAKDRATTLTEIKALKVKGINTLCPSYPQPRWFYELCTEQGMYVIDCAAIAAPRSAPTARWVAPLERSGIGRGVYRARQGDVLPLAQLHLGYRLLARFALG